MGITSTRAATVALAIGTVTAVALMGIGPASAAAPVPGAPVIDIVDTDASYATNSLYQYLLDQQGEGILFGHQHSIDDGLTFSAPNWDDPAVALPRSDVYAGTGEYPAVFGWDSLILEGREKPGSLTQARMSPPADLLSEAEYLAEYGAANAAAWARGMVRAHELGGVNTISAHMYNFVTGEDFHDTTGRVVSQILPGGPKNAEFTAYLDLIAMTADLTVAADGTSIPIIFRPFHENTGSWFWWGAAHASPGEYKEIFRYTVEYLRDVKGVDNFLYSFSPTVSSRDGYLETYPGDDFVDVFGYDAYEGDNSPANSDAYIAGVVSALESVTDLAAERGKIPALTEFGRNGDRTIRVSGNKSLTFYSDLIAAISASPQAKRITYMQTWSNWGADQFYVPYPAYDQVPEHEMYQDFLAFHNHPETVFSNGVVGASTLAANARPAETGVRFASPADGARIIAPTTTVRIGLTGETPESVSFSGAGSIDQPLTRAGAYFTGEWNPGAENLGNGATTITATATYAGGRSVSTTARVMLGAAVELPLGMVDDFENYGDDIELRTAYAYNGATAADIALTSDPVGSGSQAMVFSYDFTSRTYNGFGKSFQQDWSSFDQMSMWLDPDASNQKMALQLNTANGQSFEAYPSLAGDDPVQLRVPFSEFRAKSDGHSPTAEELESTTSFWVYINEVGEFGASSISVDDIMAVDSTVVPITPTDPVDPTDPTDPTEPTEPVDPAPGQPETDGASSAAPDLLAATGSDVGRLGALGAAGLVLLLGGAALIIRRRGIRD